MPILDLQRRMRELGRIRTGNQVASGQRKRPNKLDTFRLTSESRELIAAAAALYGGVVVPWNNDGNKEFEVITTTDRLDIVVPPGQPVSQWNELWSGGGCLRRCDGYTNVLTMTPCGSAPTVVSTAARSREIPPCPSDPAERNEAAQAGLACKATTRLNVILPRLPDIGVWRLESHGYYAAVELAATAEIVAMATATGRLIPCRLRLEQREKKVPGKAPNKYAVPIMELVETNIGDLGIVGIGPGGTAALGAGAGSPQLGPGTARPSHPPVDLPETSDLRGPAVTSTSVAGDVLDPDDPDAAPETARLLTHPELTAALEAAGIDHDVAVVRSKELFPRDAGVPLTDEQRGALLADLTAPAVVQEVL